METSLQREEEKKCHENLHKALSHLQEMTHERNMLKIALEQLGGTGTCQENI